MINIMHTGKSNRILASALLCLPIVVWGSAGAGRAVAAPQGEAAAKALVQKKVAKPPQKSAEPQAETKPAAKPVEGNLRDPFAIPKAMASVVENQAAEGTAALGPLPPGTRGLIIDELKLEGIVRRSITDPKMIAVLANPANRAYFLHENDPLYNGAVTKITPDTVYFREDYRDQTGNLLSREVTKQLAPAPGEKK